MVSAVSGVVFSRRVVQPAVFMITRKRRINRPNERQEKTVLVLLIACFLFALLNSSSVMCYTAETIEHFW